MSDKSLITGSFTSVGIVGLILICLFIYINLAKLKLTEELEKTSEPIATVESSLEHNQKYNSHKRQDGLSNQICSYCQRKHTNNPDDYALDENDKYHCVLFGPNGEKSCRNPDINIVKWPICGPNEYDDPSVITTIGMVCITTLIIICIIPCIIVYIVVNYPLLIIILLLLIIVSKMS